MKWFQLSSRFLFSCFFSWAWCFIVLPQCFWCDFAFPYLAQVTSDPPPTHNFNTLSQIQSITKFFYLTFLIDLIHHFSLLFTAIQGKWSNLFWTSVITQVFSHPSFSSISNAHNVARGSFQNANRICNLRPNFHFLWGKKV